MEEYGLLPYVVIFGFLLAMILWYIGNRITEAWTDSDYKELDKYIHETYEKR